MGEGGGRGVQSATKGGVSYDSRSMIVYACTAAAARYPRLELTAFLHVSSRYLGATAVGIPGTFGKQQVTPASPNFNFASVSHISVSPCLSLCGWLTAVVLFIAL